MHQNASTDSSSTFRQMDQRILRIQTSLSNFFRLFTFLCTKAESYWIEVVQEEAERFKLFNSNVSKENQS